ncbi:hypothetical protein L218DRAFT_1071690 [Marasmius fiardii PR-910]|nr:hypothetical protein L218DRAFT_1071690 [Marasmius fiardii PR-910]
MTRAWFLTTLLFLYLMNVGAILNKWEATSFCKCICFQSNYSILHLTLPDHPSQPCLSCTKQWCLNQNLPICAGAKLGDADPDTATGKEGDVEARCFQRDSPRDQLVVTLFLLIVFGLLLGAGIKNRMEKAGFNMTLGRSNWWETWMNRRPLENISLSRFTNIYRGERGFAARDTHEYNSKLMGSLCSKPDTHSGGHTVIGPSQPSRPAAQAPSSLEDRRNAAAEAAERRLKAAQERGTNASNPNRGQLAAKVAKPVKFTPEERPEERLVWD